MLARTSSIFESSRQGVPFLAPLQLEPTEQVRSEFAARQHMYDSQIPAHRPMIRVRAFLRNWLEGDPFRAYSASQSMPWGAESDFLVCSSLNEPRYVRSAIFLSVLSFWQNGRFEIEGSYCFLLWVKLD